MKKTVLITGSSSGIGQAAALAFAAEGWNVAATMRRPEQDKSLQGKPGLRLYALDVTKPESIEAAFAAVMKDFGRIDVVVNNAGYGVDGAFEGMSDEVIAQQFETNVFGLMRVTRAAITAMREHGGGTIIQIASVGGRLTFPMYSIYHGTKWAVEGFSESLMYELAPLGIRMKIVEPGPIRTDFYDRSRVFVKPDHTKAYDEMLAKAEKMSQDTGKGAVGPEWVAKTILRAAKSNNGRLRYTVGQPGPLMIWLRKRVPQSWFFAIMRMAYKFPGYKQPQASLS